MRTRARRSSLAGGRGKAISRSNGDMEPLQVFHTCRKMLKSCMLVVTALEGKSLPRARRGGTLIRMESTPNLRLVGAGRPSRMMRQKARSPRDIGGKSLPKNTAVLSWTTRGRSPETTLR